jgi:hypothetical protein
LKKEARELNIEVNFQVNGASCDASKEVKVANRVLEKQILTAVPLLAVEIPAERHFLLNNEFCLIKLYFQMRILTKP